MSARFFFLTFDLRFDPAATCPYLWYSVSYKNIKIRQIITFEDNLINLKTSSVLNSEVRITTQFWKYFNHQYQVRNINKKINVAAFRFTIYKAVSYDE